MRSGSDPIPMNSPCTSISKSGMARGELALSVDAWEGELYEENRSDYQAFQTG